MALSNSHSLKKPFSQSANQVVKQLNSNVVFGLTKKQVEERLMQFGKNEMQLFGDLKLFKNAKLRL